MEIDALAKDHGHHVGAEVGQTAVSRVVAEDIPLECLPEKGNIHARPAEIHHGQAAERFGQELQQQILEDRDEVGHDHKESTLPHPFRSGRVPGRKVVPEIHAVFSLVRSALMQPLFQLCVEDDVLDCLIGHPQQADDPESLCFHHDAIHHPHAHRTVGHLGQSTQRHIILE